MRKTYVYTDRLGRRVPEDQREIMPTHARGFGIPGSAYNYWDDTKAQIRDGLQQAWDERHKKGWRMDHTPAQLKRIHGL